jgi:branched-chain amino acid transport system permease protein
MTGGFGTARLPTGRRLGGRLLVGLAIIALVLAFLALPHALKPYYLGLATKMLIFALFAMSLDLLMGYGGLPSLGHAAYFGVASYAVALLLLKAGVPGAMAFVASLLVAVATGAVLGALSLRARGSYFLMITFALAQVLWAVAFGWRTMTNGDDGMPNVPRPHFLWSLDTTAGFYYFVLAAFFVATLLLVAIVRSPFGKALKGIRESESRMEALGYNVWLHHYVAFVLSATFAGLAGTLYAYFNRFVGPEYLYVIQSAEGLIMVILGGAGTLVGPAIGAALIVYLEDFVSSMTEHWVLVLGVIYVLTTLFAPHGLVGLWVAWRQRRAESP